MARNDDYSKEFEREYKKYRAKTKKVTEKLNIAFNTWANEWVKRNAPFKVGDVLEVVDNKRMKFQRMVIYQIAPQIIDSFPIVSAYGWWLDKNNDPVKWNGGGYPVLNCHTSYKMVLSDNQVNHPVKENVTKD